MLLLRLLHCLCIFSAVSLLLCPGPLVLPWEPEEKKTRRIRCFIPQYFWGNMVMCFCFNFKLYDENYTWKEISNSSFLPKRSNITIYFHFFSCYTFIFSVVIINTPIETLFLGWPCGIKLLTNTVITNCHHIVLPFKSLYFSERRKKRRSI